jgi:hypothetical protein
MYQKAILMICTLLILGAGIVPAQAGLQAGLVAYFKLDETSGNFAADASGNGNNGTLTGTALSWVPGYDGGALAIAPPATGDVADRLEFPTNGMSTAAGTVAVWANLADPQPASSGRYIFGHTAQPQWSSRIQIYMQDGTNVSRKVDLGLGGNHTAGVDVIELPMLEWLHVALTWNNGAAVLYVNGAQVAAVSYTALTTLNAIANFGNDGSSGPYEAFGGMLDEARVYNRALTVAEVRALFQSNKWVAQSPSPADKAADVLCETALDWTAGGLAGTHDVYFGKTFADVNEASRATPKGVLASQGQTAVTYDPAGLLEYGQTYYWRIDEVNKTPDNAIFKGNVWSFTVEPYGYPVQPVKATASSNQAGMGPEKTIDGSGLTGDLHGTEPTTMWMSAGVQPNWIQYEFDKAYKLHQLVVWNSNQLIEGILGFGAKKVTVETSTDGTTWTPVADVPEFAKAPGAPDYAANTTVSLGGVEAKYVKLTIDATWGGIAPQAGLAEVQFSSVPVQARAPQPAAGAVGVPVDAELSWRPGREATSHQVYFGTDPNALTMAKTVTERRYDAGSLSFGTKYYWKVDEAGAAVTYPGEVWSFTTQEYQPIEDFESYTDKSGEEIFMAWIDGFTNGTNGSTVGYMTASGGTFGETKIVHGGRQSMPLAYDNTKAPNFSEAERTFSPGQDWTGNGAEEFVVYFRGSAPGFAETASGSILMNAIGTDIWNNGDQFRFAYKTLSGDGTMVARVDSVFNSNVWAKGGVMIRQSIEPGSVHAFMPITPGGSSAGNGASFQRRPTANGASANNDSTSLVAAPYWVKIERKGNDFSGYISPDGKTWTQLGTAQTITMTNPVLIGLALCSHDAAIATGAAFSNVSTTGNVTGTWQVAEIGAAQPAGNSVEGLYLSVKDSAGKTKVVQHPDAAATAFMSWQQWTIPLSEFTSAGVKMTAVKSLTIGVGNKAAPKAGGTGTIYVDDIGFGHSLP